MQENGQIKLGVDFSTSLTYNLCKKTDKRIACYICKKDWPKDLKDKIEDGSEKLKDYIKEDNKDDNYCGTEMNINPEHTTDDKKCEKTEICYKLTIKKEGKIMLRRSTFCSQISI